MKLPSKSLVVGMVALIHAGIVAYVVFSLPSFLSNTWWKIIVFSWWLWWAALLFRSLRRMSVVIGLCAGLLIYGCATPSILLALSFMSGRSP
jgi:hypothetical protein